VLDAGWDPVRAGVAAEVDVVTELPRVRSGEVRAVEAHGAPDLFRCELGEFPATSVGGPWQVLE